MSVYYKTKSDGTRVWYYDLCVDGKRRRGVGGRSKREALNTLAEMRSKYHKGEFDPWKKAKDPRFDEFAEKFLLWSRTNKRSWKRDEQLIGNLKRWFGDRRLSLIGAEDVETYKIERTAEKRRCGNVELDRPVSNATVNREIACLKKMYNLAIKWKDTKKNPVRGVEFLQEAPKKERYITEEEFSKLYEAACPALKPVLLVAYNTGLRLEEFLGLEWSQVQLNDPPIEIVGLDGVRNFGHIQVVDTKSGESRVVPINKTLWEYLRTQSNEGYVLRASHGDRFRSIKSQFKTALRNAGLQPARVHDLRASWAMRLLENGVDPYTVMKIGGWKSMKAFERYMRHSQRNLILAVQTLDSVPPICHQWENDTKKIKTKVA